MLKRKLISPTVRNLCVTFGHQPVECQGEWVGERCNSSWGFPLCHIQLCSLSSETNSLNGRLSSDGVYSFQYEQSCSHLEKWTYQAFKLCCSLLLNDLLSRKEVLISACWTRTAPKGKKSACGSYRHPVLCQAASQAQISALCFKHRRMISSSKQRWQCVYTSVHALRCWHTSFTTHWCIYSKTAPAHCAAKCGNETLTSEAEWSSYIYSCTTLEVYLNTLQPDIRLYHF